MKKILLSLITLCMLFPATDEHDLSGLWKEYRKAHDADKPQSEMKALEAIMTEAKAQRKAWDFYDAGRKYVEAVGRRNWKESDAAQAAFDTQIKEYAEPVLMFFQYYKDTSYGLTYIQENKDKLLQTHNPEFYSIDHAITSLYYDKVILESINNDYEYGLLSLAFYGIKEARPVAEEYFANRYPLAQLLEYRLIGGQLPLDARKKSLEEFAFKNKDKAACLLARQDLLWYKFDGLQRDSKSTSQQYKDLDTEMRAFEDQRKIFSKSEPTLCKCCSSVVSYLSTLNKKELDFSVVENLVSLTFRNVQTAKITVKKDKKNVYQAVIKNPTCSFYLQDKATFKLPDLDDADYEVNLSATGIDKENEPNRGYSKHTISFSSKKDADGYAIYAADYKSGKPLDKVDIDLYNDAGKHIASAKDLKLQKGYTYLPEEVSSKINSEKNADVLEVSFTDASGRFRSSRRDDVPYSYTRYAPTPRTTCRLLCDRTAFNPGETVHFKTILYETGMTAKLLGAGVEHKAKLFDVQGKEIGKTDLTTSEFGSAAGEFLLERRDRNGQYRLVIYDKNGGQIASQSLTVDDFVLPSFALTWDRIDRRYFPGDKITVSGKVTAYSGHSLTSSEVTYEVLGFIKDDDTQSGKLTLSPDGRFKIEFTADKTDNSWRQYGVRIKVVDSTGETQEFSRSISVNESFWLSVMVLNQTTARCNLEKEADEPESNHVSDALVLGDEAKVNFLIEKYPSLNISYKLLKGKTVVTQGSAKANEEMTLNLKEQPSGLYYLVVEAKATSEKGQKFETEALVRILKLSKDDKALDVNTKCMYATLPGDDISVLLGTTTGPRWVVVELYDATNKVLEKKLVSLEGKRGQQGSLVKISYPYKDEYTGVVTMRLLYFENSNCWTESYTVRRPVSKYALPLEFTRFKDETRPHTEYTFTLKTAPNVECAATIYDISLSRISANDWNMIYKNESVPEPNVRFSECSGCATSSYYYETSPRFLERAMSKMVGNGVARRAAVNEDMMVVADEMPSVTATPEAMGAAAEEEKVDVREDFATMICWQPQLHSDAKGNVDLKFTTSDKLSTFYVQIFAHDKKLNTKTLRSEMQVTLPVQVSVVPPQFLYEGDKYSLKASLSNTTDKTVSGTVTVQYPGGSKSGKVSIKAGNSLSYECPIGKLTTGAQPVTVKFIADDKTYGSDAVKVTIPVLPAQQRITECHSAVYLAGMNKAEIEKSLRSQFVNASGPEAKLTERTIIDMIREAVPDKFVPESENVLSQTESLYAGVLATSLGSTGLTDEQRAKIIAKIRECRNDDGGFGWFPGMESSPIITSTLLQRFAGLRDRGLAVKELEDLWPKAATYIDNAYFGKNGLRPVWCGGLSMGQYMYTRALYSEVGFSKIGTDGKVWREFVKEAKEYLIPTKARGLQGEILAKARRLRTLKLLLENKGGEALAKDWGITFGTKQKLAASVQADVESLLEYAVDHKCGGAYYPNAVMPWRGLQESELYAHSLLCDLMRDCGHDPLADKVRLWIMIQKETQQWYNDPAYVEAISSVLDGSEEMKQTTVLVLTADVTKPFATIKAAGNGMKLKRVFFRDDKELKDGDVLKVGDRITAKYSIWNEENRSFVKLSVPRPAAFRPVAQLSGHYGWWLRPISVVGWISFSPQGYRSVLKESTEYWFDSYPEENTTITEEFYVTQAGTFQSPVPEIESLYAPHYRANDAGHPAYIVK